MPNIARDGVVAPKAKQKTIVRHDSVIVIPRVDIQTMHRKISLSDVTSSSWWVFWFGALTSCDRCPYTPPCDLLITYETTVDWSVKPLTVRDFSPGFCRNRNSCSYFFSSLLLLKTELSHRIQRTSRDPPRRNNTSVSHKVSVGSIRHSFGSL
jgi:hypothetical protein